MPSGAGIQSVETLEGCARCGKTHVNLTFTLLDKPIVHGEIYPAYTFWCPCPYNGQPILMWLGAKGRVRT
jgi:hypothetical protein